MFDCGTVDFEISRLYSLVVSIIFVLPFCLYPNSFSKVFSHRPLIAFDRAMNSASFVERATKGCREAFQLGRLLPSKKIYPVREIFN